MSDLALKMKLSHYIELNKNLLDAEEFKAIYVIDIEKKDYVFHLFKDEYISFKDEHQRILKRIIKSFSEESILNIMAETSSYNIICRRLDDNPKHIFIIMADKKLPIGKVMAITKTTLQKVK